jgi:hypothetical protein
VERSVDQRLGAPGARPVKPGGEIKGSSIWVSSMRWMSEKDEQNPT